MSIYDNPEEYAKLTYITLEQATLRCKHFKKLEKEIEEAKKCPKCGKHTLEYEGGSYEEGIKEYVYCENDQIETVDEEGDTYFDECDFWSDVTEQFQPLMSWYDFDILLMLCDDIEEKGIEEVERQVGSPWSEFVNKTIKEESAS